VQNGALTQIAHDFIASLVVVATLVGTYWAAAAINQVWIFWVLAGLAASYAVLRFGIRRIRPIWERLRKTHMDGRNYPAALKRAGELTAENEDLKTEVEALRLRADDRYVTGLLEGRSRVVGELTASACGSELAPVAMENIDGIMRFGADIRGGEEPEAGSVWLLRLRVTGAIKALLKVEAVTERSVVLVVDSDRDAAYMESLRSRATSESDVPASLEIKSRSYGNVEELKQEA
jgi:hypothetical protein